jgi:hypothetical protein
MIEMLEHRLATKRQNLENEQKYFEIDMKNIDSPTYEDNAINALLSMKKLKTEIAELEIILQIEQNTIKEVK